MVNSIFNCVRLSIAQNQKWQNTDEISAIPDQITKFLQSNEINFVTLKFFQKRLSLLAFKKVSKACQKVKVHNPPNHVNDKNKSVLFNNEKVTYPWVIKFSEIKNCFSQQGFEAIMKKLGIGIDINLDNKVLIVKIIGIGNKH